MRWVTEASGASYSLPPMLARMSLKLTVPPTSEAVLGSASSQSQVSPGCRLSEQVMVTVPSAAGLAEPKERPFLKEVPWGLPERSVTLEICEGSETLRLTVGARVPFAPETVTWRPATGLMGARLSMG